MPSATGYTPNLEKVLKPLKHQSLTAATETLISLFKRKQIRGSEPCAVATAHILLQVVAKSRWTDADQLLQQVAKAGQRLANAAPNELVIANVTRRVLGLIRDEAAEDRGEPSSETASDSLLTPTEAVPNPSSLTHQWPAAPYTKQDAGSDYISGSTRTPPRPGFSSMPSTFSSLNVPKTLFHLLSDVTELDTGSQAGQNSPVPTGTSTPTWRGSSSQVSALKSEVIDGIEEIKDEISQVDEQIAALAEVQIHPGDHVLIHRPSPTVQGFILKAAMKRKFTVLFAVSPPSAGSSPFTDPATNKFLTKLASLSIPVVKILNGGISAYMSRINKVVLGARGVMANGSVVCEAGAAAVARAAQEHGNAVIALSGIYKLSPENAFDEDSAVEWADSAAFLRFDDGSFVDGVDVKSAVTELVPPELVDTYITNLGTHTQDHLSSLIADHYKPEDVDFMSWEFETEMGKPAPRI